MFQMRMNVSKNYYMEFKIKYIKHFLSAFCLGLVFSGILFVVPTFAQGIKDKSMLESIANKAGVDNVGSAETLAGTVIKAILSVTGLIFLILMVYAGIMWMIARGDDAKVEKARDIIQAAVIGLAITVSAYAITVFVSTQFAK